jgi:hypothetical protein
VEANSTGGQGSRRAVAPSDDVELPVLTRYLNFRCTFLKSTEYQA